MMFSLPCELDSDLLLLRAGFCWLLLCVCLSSYPFHLTDGKLLPVSLDPSNFLILSWLILASFSQAFTDSGCWFGSWELIRHCSALWWIKVSISLITSSLEMECPAALSLCVTKLWADWAEVETLFFYLLQLLLDAYLSCFLLIFPLFDSWCFITKCFHMSCLAMMSLNLSGLMPSFFASDGQNFLSPWSCNNPWSIFWLMSSVIFSIWEAVNSFFPDSSKCPFLFDLLPPANPLNSCLAVADGLPPHLPKFFPAHCLLNKSLCCGLIFFIPIQNLIVILSLKLRDNSHLFWCLGSFAEL